jgi:hypothetical protein
LLELRVEPDTIVIYRGQKLIAQHPRSYGRNQDIENPDHLSRLLTERKRAEDAALLARFLALSPKAETYFSALRGRELHAMGHVRRILMLVDTHGRDAVAQALQEAVELGAPLLLRQAPVCRTTSVSCVWPMYLKMPYQRPNRPLATVAAT